jgi:hypothetical protein
MREQGSSDYDVINSALLIAMAVAMVFFTLFSGVMAVLRH